MKRRSNHELHSKSILAAFSVLCYIKDIKGIKQIHILINQLTEKEMVKQF